MRFLRLSSLILLTEGLIKGPDFKLETEFLSPEAIDEFLEDIDLRKGTMTHLLWVISITFWDKKILKTFKRLSEYHYKTYENDNLVAIEIADKRIGKDNNEYIVIECGINPSHWIAIHSCLNFLQNPSAIELTGKVKVIYGLRLSPWSSALRLETFVFETKMTLKGSIVHVKHSNFGCSSFYKIWLRLGLFTIHAFEYFGQ